MKVSSAVLIFSLAVSAPWSTHALDFPLSPHGPNAWMAPAEDDVRSPCPFINVAANHGLINRSGKNVDIFDMVDVLSETFDVSPQLFAILAQGAINLNFTETDENGTVVFDIDELFAHNKQEHDASIARTDFFFGEEESKEPNKYLLDGLFGMNPASHWLAREDLMDFQSGRILDSKMNNPEVSITEAQTTSFSAQATLLMIFGRTDANLTSVDKARLEELLRYERLPADYVPQATIDPDFEPFNVIGEGTLANDVRLEFAANFEDVALGDGMNDMDDMNGMDDMNEGDDEEDVEVGRSGNETRRLRAGV